jgi:hypothetical protein
MNQIIKLIALAIAAGVVAGVASMLLVIAFAEAFGAIAEGVSMSRSRGGPATLQLLACAAVGWVAARAKWKLSDATGAVIEGGMLVVACLVLGAVLLLGRPTMKLPEGMLSVVMVFSLIGLVAGYLGGVFQASRV